MYKRLYLGKEVPPDRRSYNLVTHDIQGAQPRSWTHPTQPFFKKNDPETHLMTQNEQYNKAVHENLNYKQKEHEPIWKFSKKTNFPGVRAKYSEIENEQLLTKKYEPEEQKAVKQIFYPRNLNVDDIEGTKTGSLDTKFMKNWQIAQTLKIQDAQHPDWQRPARKGMYPYGDGINTEEYMPDNLRRARDMANRNRNKLKLINTVEKGYDLKGTHIGEDQVSLPNLHKYRAKGSQESKKSVKFEPESKFMKDKMENRSDQPSENQNNYYRDGLEAGNRDYKQPKSTNNNDLDERRAIIERELKVIRQQKELMGNQTNFQDSEHNQHQSNYQPRSENYDRQGFSKEKDQYMHQSRNQDNNFTRPGEEGIHNKNDMFAGMSDEELEEYQRVVQAAKEYQRYRAEGNNVKQNYNPSSAVQYNDQSGASGNNNSLLPPVSHMTNQLPYQSQNMRYSSQPRQQNHHREDSIPEYVINDHRAQQRMSSTNMDQRRTSENQNRVNYTRTQQLPSPNQLRDSRSANKGERGESNEDLNMAAFLRGKKNQEFTLDANNSDRLKTLNNFYEDFLKEQSKRRSPMMPDEFRYRSTVNHLKRNGIL